jgi:hypothetical protein
MIDRTHALPVARQCQVLSLARSTAYYRPQEASQADLALLRRIDEPHLDCGSRMLRDILRAVVRMLRQVGAAIEAHGRLGNLYFDDALAHHADIS